MKEGLDMLDRNTWTQLMLPRMEVIPHKRTLKSKLDGQSLVACCQAHLVANRYIQEDGLE